MLVLEDIGRDDGRGPDGPGGRQQLAAVRVPAVEDAAGRIR
jgi:hypothetical protein